MNILELSKYEMCNKLIIMAIQAPEWSNDRFREEAY